MRLVDERLKRDCFRLQRCRRRVGGNSRGAANVRDRSAVLYSVRNFQSEFLAISRILRVLRLGWIGEKAALDQDGGDPRVSQNIKPAPTHPAIRRWRAPGHVIMNGGREPQPLGAVKVGLDSARASPWGGIEVNANENRVTILVGNCNARSERDENVAVSRHHYMIAGGLKDRFQTLRDLEVHCLLVHTLTSDAATIKSAMASVDHNRGRWPGAFSNNRCACLRLRTRSRS